MPSLAALARGANDHVFPPRCGACGRGQAFLCDRCIGALRPNLVAPDEETPPPLSAIWAPYRYEDPARKAVLALKFDGISSVGEPIGNLMAAFAVSRSLAADAVVPVPLHPRRQRQRGYDQAALLARPVSRALNLPLTTNVLRRERNTRPQAGTPDAGERRANVSGAFTVTDVALADGRRFLLVDDGATTGATLAACATALDAAGAASVAALVFAREQ